MRLLPIILTFGFLTNLHAQVTPELDMVLKKNFSQYSTGDNRWVYYPANAKIEKLTEQQNTHYETLLQQEIQKSESLQKEIQNIRDELEKEWRSQNDFNKRLEEAIEKPKIKWGGLLSIFRK